LDSPTPASPTGHDAPPKTLFNQIVGWVLLILIFVVAPFAASALLWSDRCKRTVRHAEYAPDGHRRLVTVATDCGQKMPPATEVILVDDPSPDAKLGRPLLVLSGVHDVEIAWQGNEAARLTIPPNVTVVKRDPEDKGVKLEYVGP
jgi:hypothetical protein